MTEQTAILFVGDFHSDCGRCHLPAVPQDTHHTRTAGGRHEPPCGARFTAIRHVDGRGKEHALRALRPDLPFA